MKENILRLIIVPVFATIGIIYLWLEFGSESPVWWPIAILAIFAGHYAAYFMKHIGKEKNG